MDADHRLTRLASRLAATVLVLAAVLAAGILVLAPLGLRPVVIRSGSMTPALHTGDLVISRSIRARELRPGDIVTFHAPRLGGDLVTHRVVSVTPQAGSLLLITKGDANRVTENWAIGPAAEVGLGAAHLRYAGWWFLLLATGAGRAAVIGLACLWGAAAATRRIWARE